MIALKPDHAMAYNNRGIVLQELKRPADALASYDRAITLKPDYAEAHDMKRLEEAVASYDKAIALKPDDTMAHNNRGFALLDLNKLKKY